jgi:hypothetical protein
MESWLASTAAPTVARSSVAPAEKEHGAVGILGATAFVLLAVALCARALLDEGQTVPVAHLLRPPEERLLLGQGASLMPRYVSHLLAAGGIGLAVLWGVLSRHGWRWGGLETGALVLIGGALLSVPVASDKRLALNTAIDTILPLFAAAALYQLLGRSTVWRRALLAGLVAMAAANCCKATLQRYWEYTPRWDAYQRSQGTFWSQLGISLDDSAIAVRWANKRSMRPRGFIQGINVLSSFLLLGLAATGAGLAGAAWWRPGGRPIDRGADEESAHGTPRRHPTEPGAAARRPTNAGGGHGAVMPTAFKPGVFIVAAALAALATWHLWLLLAIQKTIGAMVAIAAAVVVGAAALRMRDRPGRLAILLATGLVLLQTTLIVLTLSPPGLHRALVHYKGPGRKIGSLGYRFYIWEGSVRLFLAHPFTGIGPSQFRKHFLAVRPSYCGVAAVGAHNWLLNVAAEWGILGVLGVLIAVGGAGWSIVQALTRPPDQTNRPALAALSPAILVTLGCWLMVATDLPCSQWAEVLPYPMAVCLVAAALVSLCRLGGMKGQVILLAGLVGLVVHCAVEETPNVVGVMWPFWAMVALAMAWNGHLPATSFAQTPARRCMTWAGMILVGAVALAVVVLTVRPLRAVGLMQRAQQAVAAHRPVLATELLWAAAAADPLDPLPLSAAAPLRYGLGQTDAPHAIEHLRDCVALSQAAVQRNAFDYESWRSLGLAHMFLACTIEDFTLVDEAIRDMRRALDLNPYWPAGWLDLARMAAVRGGQGEQPALLRIALDALDKALFLEDGRVDDVAPTLTAKDRAELLRLREQVSRRLQASRVRAAATQAVP